MADGAVGRAARSPSVSGPPAHLEGCAAAPRRWPAGAGGRPRPAPPSCAARPLPLRRRRAGELDPGAAASAPPRRPGPGPLARGAVAVGLGRGAPLDEAVADGRQRADRACSLGREAELLPDVADVGLEEAGVAALVAPGVV